MERGGEMKRCEAKGPINKSAVFAAVGCLCYHFRLFQKTFCMTGDNAPHLPSSSCSSSEIVGRSSGDDQSSTQRRREKRGKKKQKPEVACQNPVLKSSGRDGKTRQMKSYPRKVSGMKGRLDERTQGWGWVVSPETMKPGAACAREKLE